MCAAGCGAQLGGRLCCPGVSARPVAGGTGAGAGGRSLTGGSQGKSAASGWAGVGAVFRSQAARASLTRSSPAAVVLVGHERTVVSVGAGRNGGEGASGSVSAASWGRLWRAREATEARAVYRIPHTSCEKEVVDLSKAIQRRLGRAAMA